ncbi:DNA cytosine methyltransferase [Arthrobacter sp. EH-1B-1]|uniref:Cytosine-specific methyltransferase n=1 Tax=Arthrobacter vasquezii TaxID=2977629 RepID=A0ABT6CQ30_9MICC|nr:DNA cytosine methyltransferase [Arthrobacter vasquezii]MDF9276250.1 DNA cytosine methyltransferase [Arthrobacter vasquezii]
MKYVDLFSGCGGLSLGIERSGGQLVLAVEKSDMAARTFYHNFLGDASDVGQWERYVASGEDNQIAARLLVRELGVLLANVAAMDDIRANGLDLVVGGPPCQGFSLAGRRNPADVRNELPWQYLKFVSATRPRAVVIENVVGMDRSFAAGDLSSFHQLQQALTETGDGYVVQGVHVNAVHYGAPQHRPRLLIIALRSDVAAGRGVTATNETWRSGFVDQVGEDIPALAPRPTSLMSEMRSVGDAVGDLMLRDSDPAGLGDYAISLSAAFKYGRKGPGENAGNHIRRRHNDRTTQRFRLYQYLSLNRLDQRMLSQAARLPETESKLLLKHRLLNAPLPAISPDGVRLAESLDDLIDLAQSLATRKHSQKVLAWGEPARTVVTLPDDYVHPLEPRVFTVREMARFQGFPDDFEFLGKETTGSDRRRTEVPQYSQVGNAVSPWLALAIGRRLHELLFS